jgi:hypothetical protein
MDKDNRAWFGRKRIGWGYGPRGWEGWLTVVLYLLLMLGLPAYLGPRLGDNGVRILWIALTILFFVVFFWKLERRRSP